MLGVPVLMMYREADQFWYLTTAQPGSDDHTLVWAEPVRVVQGRKAQAHLHCDRSQQFWFYYVNLEGDVCALICRALKVTTAEGTWEDA